MNPNKTKKPFNFLKRPKRLYSYFPPAAVELFSSGKLWSSQPGKCNDLFEFLPSQYSLIKSWFAKAVQGAAKQRKAMNLKLTPDLQQQFKENTTKLYKSKHENIGREFQERVDKTYGFFCFSTTVTNALMWGHYGKGHNGFAVEFNPNHSMFSPSNFAACRYRKIRPSADDEDYRKIILTKSNEWKYENEFRLIKHVNEMKLGVRNDSALNYIQLLPESVKSVYFGYKMKPEFRRKLVADLNCEKWKHVEKFLMTPHPSKYSVQAIPWQEITELTPQMKKEITEMFKASGM